VEKTSLPKYLLHNDKTPADRIFQDIHKAQDKTHKNKTRKRCKLSFDGRHWLKNKFAPEMLKN
jgi:hypothetical protein